MRLKVVYSVCVPVSGQRSTYIARAPWCSSFEAGQQRPSTTLKACLQAICLTRPDLVPSPSADYAVSVLDVTEAERIFEGKGMMGWLLADDGDATTVTGRLLDENAGEQTLEIVLELVPRMPVDRSQFLSSLNSTQQSASNAPTPATVSANEDSSMDKETQMMTAMFAAAVKENKQSALQFFNQMFQNGHSNGQQGSTSLLPNLFNAERAIQQQRNTSRAPSEPVKAMASRPVSRSSVGSSAQKHDEESNTATASKKAGPAMVAIPRLKHWPAGCLKCGRTESTQWRVRKKRMRPLDGSDIAITEDGEEEVKKLCEECAQDLPSMRKRRAAEEEAASTSLANAASTSTSTGRVIAEGKVSASGLPVLTYDHTARARPRATAAVKQNKAAATQIQTSPLRRSPRKLASAVPNVRRPASGKAQQAQPFTSPSRPTEELGSGSGSGPVAGSKRRKFTTALSAVALREEMANSPAATKLEEPPQPKKRRITPTNLSKSVPAPDRFKSPSFGSSAAAAAGADEDDFHFLGASASYCPSSSKADIEKQKKQAKAVFDSASPRLPPALSRTTSQDNITTNFLMNASPGTAIRTLLGETPKLGKLSAGFGSVNDTPGKLFGKYLLEGLALPAGLTSFDIPDIGASKFNEANIDPALVGSTFSPSASTLSTPFRNAIFQTATSKTPAGPVAPVSPGKRISPSRATSEQPPSAHEKLLATLTGPHGPSGLAMSQTMHLSSDDTNFGFSTASNGGHPLINLLPPTADRSRSIVAGLPMHGSEFTSDMPSSYPDALLDDFSSFLLKTSSSLLTSPSPPRKTTARPGLAIPGAGVAGNRRHSTPTPLNFAPSSEAFDTDKLDPSVDIDMRDLPPSSPPPLPTGAISAGSDKNSQYQNYLDSFLAGFAAPGADDTQSPISVGTSATQGGTPQEHPTPFSMPQAAAAAQSAAKGKSSYGPNTGYHAKDAQSSETSFDVDMSLLSGAAGSKGGGGSSDALRNIDEGVGLDDDPLLSFFGQGKA